jgi:hypothetical protein
MSPTSTAVPKRSGHACACALHRIEVGWRVAAQSSPKQTAEFFHRRTGTETYKRNGGRRVGAEEMQWIQVVSCNSSADLCGPLRTSAPSVPLR